VIKKAETGDLDTPPALPATTKKAQYLAQREKRPESILEGKMSEEERHHKKIELQQFKLKTLMEEK
jgi:hypothetical protein